MLDRRALVRLGAGGRILREHGVLGSVARLGRDVDVELLALEPVDGLLELQPFDARYGPRVLLREEVPGNGACGEEQQQHRQRDRDRVARPPVVLLDADGVAVDRTVRMARDPLGLADDHSLGLDIALVGVALRLGDPALQLDGFLFDRPLGVRPLVVATIVVHHRDPTPPPAPQTAPSLTNPMRAYIDSSVGVEAAPARSAPSASSRRSSASSARSSR